MDNSDLKLYNVKFVKSMLVLASSKDRAFEEAKNELGTKNIFDTAYNSVTIEELNYEDSKGEN